MAFFQWLYEWIRADRESEAIHGSVVREGYWYDVAPIL
jgi:hypothetical protein